MKILVNIRHLLDELELAPADIINGPEEQFKELKEQLHAEVVAQFNAQSEGTSCYIYDEDDYEGAEYQFGALARQEILNVGESWNENIRASFRRSVVNLLLEDVIPLDNPMTYEAQKAARELDNNWFPYARHAVMDSDVEHGTFQTVLTHAQEDDIASDPEYWAIVIVTVK